MRIRKYISLYLSVNLWQFLEPWLLILVNKRNNNIGNREFTEISDTDWKQFGSIIQCGCKGTKAR